MKKLCDVKDISFSYNKGYKKEMKILSDISFSIKQNEIVGILGKNGCGKSTLLNIISGFLVPQQGSVYINEKKINEYSINERAKVVSYIQQKNFTIPSYYEVQDFILEGRRPYRRFGVYNEEDYFRLEHTMKQCAVEKFNTRKMVELSGGEQQRCIFAREIMKQAALFLFDEPCSAMDIKYQKEFFNIAHKVKETNRSTILITIHDINLAVQNCDRIILLNEGHLLYDGSAEQIPCKVLSQAFEVEVKDRNDNGKRYLFY